MKDCRSKNKVHRQQLNTLDGDWNVIKPEDPPGEAQLSLKQWDNYDQILEAAHQLATSGGKDLPELTGQDKGQEPLTTSDRDRDEPASIKEEIPQGSYAYSMDPRNLRHGELQWRFCTRHYCTYHEQLRRYGGHSPYHATCHKHWVNCEKDACEIIFGTNANTPHSPGTHMIGTNTSCSYNKTTTTTATSTIGSTASSLDVTSISKDKFMNRFLRTDGNGWTHCPVSGKTL